ncbi:replication factor A 73 kDa subunit [Loa loa]|uniref:Replication protein A subunit n=1 Tax=Loa loa TaxID=7209 RepID=A0A1I7VZH8_LOALO|nr:replication factor A 73 kDa subunit [Loa loa]EFO18545.2 replication factor A 73 kDa subunit [Loa loa]
MVGIGDLSRGFIQEICERNTGEERPVVQILEARPLVNSQAEPASEAQYFRFRISDGMFSYNSCLNQADITERIKRDTLDQGNPVLRIQYTIKAAQKPLLRIMDYEILGRDLPIFGSPVHHSGNPNDYRGLNPNASMHTRIELRSPQKGGLNLGQNAPVRYGGSSSRRLANLSGQNLTPIKLITPYVNKWRICGVVTAKEDLRNIRTARRDMKVFNFELTDEEGGCIRIAAFDDVAEKFYSIIQKGSMFYVSGGTVKQANKRFNTTGHDYEITIRNDSEVLPCLDREKIEQPKLSLSIVRLCNVANHVGEPIDVIAIAEKVNDIVEVTARNTGAQLEKRDIILIDASETEITLTFWGEQARTYDKEIEGQTIGIKGAFVKEYNGSLSLSIGNSSRIELNMDCAETANLYRWYRETRPSVQARNLTTAGLSSDNYARDFRIIRLSEVGALGRDSEKGIFFNVTAMISSLKADGALYKSCGTNGCKKKVIELNNQYRCEKCDITLDKYKYVLLMTVEISDFSGSHWVTVFEDKAVKLLKNDAEQLGQLLDNDLLDEYNEVFNAVRFREYTFRIRAKSEFYNGEEKIKWNVFDIHEVNLDKYIDELTRAITKLEEM